MAWNNVATVFGVPRPRLEVLCDVTDASARTHAAAFGFRRATTDWQAAVADLDPAEEDQTFCDRG